ncbi:hypothetical protein CJ030_MR5G025090 [Morella rubra]|uniref:Uncharacterized protein n=1 Tax=Morella rubra TaxID=262757 RepID=A0A6A1VHH9_9ROSI|nr:hypothetical protein CJ030_MR5G025090 [Morella rubra]
MFVRKGFVQSNCRWPRTPSLPVETGKHPCWCVAHFDWLLFGPPIRHERNTVVVHLPRESRSFKTIKGNADPHARYSLVDKRTLAAALRILPLSRSSLPLLRPKPKWRPPRCPLSLQTLPSLCPPGPLSPLFPRGLTSSKSPTYPRPTSLNPSPISPQSPPTPSSPAPPPPRPPSFPVPPPPGSMSYATSSATTSTPTR